jgi:AcrR family transcriptional regulator
VGTVYRHFPDKDGLIETLFQTRVDEMVAIAEAGLADPDPWHGFVTALERSLEIQALDRGLHQIVQASPRGLERLLRVRERLLPIGGQLIERAQAAGAIRPDVSTADIPVLQLMVGTVVDAARGVDPDLWRRYLQFVLRGLSAHPETLPELPGSPPSPNSLDVLLSQAPRRS